MLTNRKIGNLYCFWFNKEGRPALCIGPHWQFFACFCSFIVLIGCFFVFSVGPSVSAGLTAVTCLVFGTLILNYSLAALLNPGIAMFEGNKVDCKEVEDSRTYCSECEVYMDPYTEHCDDCGVCIVSYDHHCPWTSKCIGKGNLCFFNGFLVSLIVCFVFSVISLGLQARAKRISHH